jgi:hypothetical protein
MIDLLLISIFVISLLLPSKFDRTIALIFICVTVIHEIFLSDLEGFIYYGSAAFFDLLIILLLSNISTKLSINLQNLCIFSMVLNFVGWLNWFNYMPPTVYNNSYILYYLMVLITILYNGFMGKTKVDIFDTSFSSNIYSSNNNSNII